MGTTDKEEYDKLRKLKMVCRILYSIDGRIDKDTAKEIVEAMGFNGEEFRRNVGRKDNKAATPDFEQIREIVRKMDEEIGKPDDDSENDTWTDSSMPWLTPDNLF